MGQAQGAYFQGLGGNKSFARGISANGSIVVGENVFTSEYEAFRWTASGSMEGLGDLPGGSFYSYATAISADGTTIVGSSSSAVGGEAFIWDEANGGWTYLSDRKLMVWVGTG